MRDKSTAVRKTNAQQQVFMDNIELLVLNELSREQRTQLLQEVAVHPEHWKTLALAFVQNQAIERVLPQSQLQGFRTGNSPSAKTIGRKTISNDQSSNREGNADSRSLSALERKTLTQATPTAGPHVIGAERLSSQSSLSTNLFPALTKLGACFAIGACLVLSFGLGLMFSSPEVRPVVFKHEASHSEAAQVKSASSGAQASHKRVVSGGNVGERSRFNVRDQGSELAGSDSTRAGVVEWVDRNGMQNFPVFDRPELALAWVRNNPPTVDKDLQRTYARVGWDLRAKRKLVSLKLKDGKQFVIPLDDVSYRYVGRQVF